jgi:hypothetical protein
MVSHVISQNFGESFLFIATGYMVSHVISQIFGWSFLSTANGHIRVGLCTLILRRRGVYQVLDDNFMSYNAIGVGMGFQ